MKLIKVKEQLSITGPLEVLDMERASAYRPRPAPPC
jgi:hypothetical protein